MSGNRGFPKPCKWVKDKIYETWDTSCDSRFVLERGTPKENGMIFCCYCGERIVEE